MVHKREHQWWLVKWNDKAVTVITVQVYDVIDWILVLKDVYLHNGRLTTVWSEQDTTGLNFFSFSKNNINAVWIMLMTLFKYIVSTLPFFRKMLWITYANCKVNSIFTDSISSWLFVKNIPFFFFFLRYENAIYCHILCILPLVW